MNVTATATMKGYVNVTAYDQQALKAAIAARGPVSVAIDASHRTLSFYANGVYYEPDCSQYYNPLTIFAACSSYEGLVGG